MEEDTSVKAATVTRLRRRLSVEQDDVKSPSTPSTPNKKRGGRLAAKPQLELIDENSSDNTPKTGTRKTAAKIVSEVNEEKPVTPARRSARIKSNTSIISDTTLNVASPRAKRAARRTSQIGSDNEASGTPIKQTRRTRKDSTSSVDNQETASTKTTTEKIQQRQIFKDNNETSQNKPVRTSPRLRKKQNRSKSINDSLKITQETQITSTTPEKSSESKESSNPESTRNASKHDKKQNSTINETAHDNLSESSRNLIDNLETESIGHSSNVNKSTSTLEGTKNLKNNSRRTKSMTSSFHDLENDSHVCSDNDTMMAINVDNPVNLEKLIDSRNSNDDNLPNPRVHNETNDTKVTADIQGHKHDLLEKSNYQTLILNPVREDNVKKDIHNQPHELNETSKILTKTPISEILTVIDLNDSDTNSLGKSNKRINEPVNSETNVYSCNGNHDNLLNSFHEDNVKEDILKQPHDLNETSKVLAKPLNSEIITVIYLDDSDSNSSGKNNKQFDNEDQCVPFVVKSFDNEKSSADNVVDTETNQKNNSYGSNTNLKPSFNNQCEPMDIDETIPSNVSLIDVSYNKILEEKHHNSPNQKSELYSSQVDLHANKSTNRSKRESTSSPSVSRNVEKNENKSTLILSQLNDGSTTENSLSKYGKYTNSEILSKSANNETTKGKEINKNNLSLDYMTSTPLQQKSFKKLAMQINTSIINNSKCETEKNAPNKNKLQITTTTNKTNNSKDSSEESELEDESSKEMSNLLDDEAEEASEDYESGDSEDEDERQYRKENELVEKGETLTSGDEEDSDDTDYEKDSFVVSSDAEDNELLSGTGDDLSMSDNELSMSKKSKKKYNERKMKEQKKASREMFEARHNISNNSTKSEHTKAKKKNRLRLDSSTLDSEEEIGIGSKKSKRLRLESTQECNIMESESQNIKETNDNTSLSKSIGNDSGTKEHEMSTTCNVSILEKKDPLSVEVKPEPQTPLKELNMSCVPIMDKIEEIQVNTDTSVMKTNETLDPLQELSADSNSSSVSENLEITDNYEVLLKKLNTDVVERKIKSLDISLNLNKKNKLNHKEPIVEQLNLTTTKTSKKKKISETKTFDSNNVKGQNKNDDCDSSSDSINLQLLFSDDSVDNMEKEPQSKENLIPLKRTEGKTNISETNEIAEDHLSLTGRSNKKKKESLSNLSNGTEKVDSATMFIDTKGDRNKPDTSLNTCKTKNKKKTICVNDEFDSANNVNTEINDNVDKNDNNGEDISINTSIKKKKKKKPKCVSVEAYDNENAKSEDNDAVFVDTNSSRNDKDMSINNSARKKKKKKSISVNDGSNEAKDSVNTEGADNVTMFIDTIGNRSDIDMSLNTSSKKKKKKNMSVDDGSVQANDNATTEKDDSVTMFIDTKGNRSDIDMSLNTSVKKKKKKKSKNVYDESDQANENVNTESDNNPTMFIDSNDNGIDANVSLNTNAKKKKKITSVNDGSDQDNDNINTEIDNATMLLDIKCNKSDTNMSLNISTKKKKKKNKHLNDQSVEANDDATPEKDDSVTMFIDTKGNRSDTDMSLNTSAKNKKKKSKSFNDGSDQANDNVTTGTNNDAAMFINSKGNRSDDNISLNTSAKKKKKKNCTCIESYQANDNVNTVEADSVTMFIDTKSNRSDTDLSLNTSGKKKRKKCICVDDGSVQSNDNATTGKDDNIVMFINTTGNRSDADMSPNTSVKNKKKKSKNISDGSDQANDNVIQDEENDAPLEISYRRHKNVTSGDHADPGEGEDPVDSHTSQSSSAKKKKKKKKKKSDSESGAVAVTSQDAIKVPQLNESKIEERKIVPESKGVEPESNNGKNSKKRKRKWSDTLNAEGGSENNLQTLIISKMANESLSIGNQKKKQKINPKEGVISEKEDVALKKHNKKRKRDDNGIEKSAKQFKQSSPDKVNVPRLPTAILNQLDDKPSKETLEAKKSKVMSTSHFVVEDTRRKRNKPSNYLEESIYLNDSHDEKKQKGHIKIPKVLPFVPTASTSDTGFTTNFVINVIPKETKFVAQTSNLTGFKNEYLRDKNIKRVSTYRMYKTQRKAKLSKF